MRWTWLAGALLIVTASAAEAGWTGAYVRGLPDGAFAAVEARPDGRPARHLPHHDAAGCVDGPHLRSALARLGQVRWLDPAQAARAREHLDEHARAFATARPPESASCPETPPRTGDADSP